MRNRKGLRGVTLVELCFGLAIVAMLVGMAVPGFRGSLRAGAVRSATFDLLAGLQQARGIAILQAQPAELCPSDPAGRCLAAHTPASYWRASAPPASEAGPASHALPAGVVVRASRSPLRFWPDAQGASTGTLTICDTHGIAPPRAIVLSLSGRARISGATRENCR